MRTRHRRLTADTGRDLVRVYTDGSSSTKQGNGAWAIVASRFCKDSNKEVTAERFGFLPVATNITAELTGILRAFEFVRPDKERTLEVITDSEVSIKFLTQWFEQWRRNGWTTAQGRPVANVDLIKQTHAAWQAHITAGTFVTFCHVKGHTGVPGNEKADYLAGVARREGRTAWSHGDAKINWNGSIYTIKSDE